MTTNYRTQKGNTQYKSSDTHNTVQLKCIPTLETMQLLKLMKMYVYMHIFMYFKAATFYISYVYEHNFIQGVYNKIMFVNSSDHK